MSSKNKRPVVAITMGDGAGVGPEVIMKTLQDPGVYSLCRPFVVGDAARLRLAGRIVGAPVEIHPVQQVSECRFVPGYVDCVDLGLLPADLPFGAVSAEAGHAAYAYIEKAIAMTLEGQSDAVCTAPLNKEALHKGGHLFPGHTEILAQLTGTEKYAMLLMAPDLRVIHVTTHVGLLDAVRKITPDRVYTVLRLAHDTLRRAGIESPRIAVCGINPHAGENGLFGYGEEEEKIVPAVDKARSEGIDAYGPLPADTLFYRARRGDFDIVAAMYHDQGHGPIKVLGLEAGVNVTVGLPFIRTSVDHGTAFDIAGKGIADERSMKEALRQAVELTP